VPTRTFINQLTVDGLRTSDPGFGTIGKLILGSIFKLPVTLREKLLFSSSSWFCSPLQKALQRSLGGACTVKVEFTEGLLHGCVLELYSSEKYFWLGSNFESVTQEYLKKIVKTSDIVYDVGANIGFLSLLLSRLCGPGGRVFSFEPSPINFKRLQRNVELNRKDNIMPLNLAVSDIEASGFLSEEGSLSYIKSSGSVADGCSQIQMIRLDDFVFRDKHPHPSFLKIDIEGHAGHCLAGMIEILRTVRPSLVLELHHAEEAGAVYSALAEHSYRVTHLDSDKGFPRRVSAVPN
jgi:FkbM family methyltransferase